MHSYCAEIYKPPPLQRSEVRYQDVGSVERRTSLVVSRRVHSNLFKRIFISEYVKICASDKRCDPGAKLRLWEI